MWLLELPLCLTLHFYCTLLLWAHWCFGLSCPTVISWVSSAAAGLAAGPLHHSSGALWPSGPGSGRTENLGCRAQGSWPIEPTAQITGRGAGRTGAPSAWGLIYQHLMLTAVDAKWALLTLCWVPWENTYVSVRQGSLIPRDVAGMGPLSEEHLPPQLFKAHQVYFHRHCGITELWIWRCPWGLPVYCISEEIGHFSVVHNQVSSPRGYIPWVSVQAPFHPLDSQRRFKTLPRIAESNFVLVDPSVQSAYCPFLPASSPWASN